MQCPPHPPWRSVTSRGRASSFWCAAAPVHGPAHLGLPVLGLARLGALGHGLVRPGAPALGPASPAVPARVPARGAPFRVPAHPGLPVLGPSCSETSVGIIQGTVFAKQTACEWTME